MTSPLKEMLITDPGWCSFKGNQHPTSPSRQKDDPFALSKALAAFFFNAPRNFTAKAHENGDALF